MSPTAEAKPLTGIRVVVTRAPEQSAELVKRLEEQGATVISLPMVSFAPVENTVELDQCIAALSDFKWLIFTSQNALRFFLDRCDTLKTNVAEAGCSIAVVGPATARAAIERKLRVEWMPESFNAQALAAGIAGRLAGRHVLLPRSDRANSDLPAALRAAGARVTDVVAYRTVMPAALVAGRPAAVEGDIITFASPSAVHHAIDYLGDARLATMKAAAIGPATAKALADVGQRAEILAHESTAPGLVTAIVDYVRAESAGAARMAKP